MTRKPHMILMLALIAAALAATAYAATPKKPAASAAPATPSAPHEMRVIVTDDADADGAGDMEWTSEDGTKRVITRRIVRHGAGGMGAGGCEMGGPGMGRGGCDMGGPGKGPRGRGMHMGMGGPGGGCGMGGPGGCGMGHGGPGMGHGGPGMGRGMGEHFAVILRHLDLSDAQKQKMRDIHERQMRRDIQARADLQIAEMDLRQAMHAESPSTSAINAQIDKVAKLRTDMEKAHVAALMEARALLTPDQQKKARELMEKGPGACTGGGMPGCDMGAGHGGGAMPGCDMMPGGAGMGMGHGMGMGQGMGPGGMGGTPHRMRVQVMRDSVGHGAQ